MSGLFGPSQGHAVATQATRANGIQVQASSFGRALPIVYGRSRIKGELIWYGDFQAVEHHQQVGKGGGSVSTSYTYSSSFALALCEGPIQKLGAIWKDSGQTTLADLQATLLTGAAGQSPWSHWSGAQALNYPYVAYVACLNLQLGSTPTVPNLNWEVYGLLPFNSVGGIYDAEPSAILNDLLTNSQHGAGWSYLGDVSLYLNYCAANGIFISPVIEQENSALRHIGDLLTVTNSTAVWSGGKLKIVPYSDQSASGNGHTYTPPTTAVADLGVDQLIDGVTVDRKPLADLFNTIRLEYLDASNNYVTTVAEAKDQSDIDARAVRSQQTITAHAITSSALATQVAHRILNRQLYVRNTYRFKVPITQIALEPMDVVTLTDPLLALAKEPVRITQIEENGDGTLSIEAEEFPAGVAEAASYSYEPLAGYVPDSEKAPDATQPPVFFRAPQFLVDSPEVWVGVAGAGPNWGGAHVWLSWDGISYTHAGVVYRGTRYGVSKTVLNSGSDPDKLNSVTLELYGPGQLNGASTVDADRFVPLLLIDQELIAYSATTLNADGTYTLGPNYIRRGAYNTAIASHAAGAPWLRVDDHVWRFGFDPADVGKTVSIKFQAFNLVGGGLQDLSTVAAYTYVIGAAEEIPDVPPVPTNLTATPAANGVKLAWTNPNPAAVAIVSVEYSTDNATWAVLGQTNGEGLDHNFAGNATYYYRLRARSPSFAWSSYTTSVSASGGSLDHVNDGTTYGRTVQTALTSGQPDMSKVGVINRTADNVAETTGRKWAAQSGADVTASHPQARAWLTDGAEGPIAKQTTAPASPYNGQLWSDTSSTPNVLKRWDSTLAAWVKIGVTNQDELPSGPNYGQTLNTALTSGQPDLSKAGVINKTADQIAETTARKWAAEAGAQKNNVGANLVHKANFEDGSIGDWSRTPITDLSVVAAAAGLPFTKVLQAIASTTGFDIFEPAVDIPVAPNQPIYIDGWLDTSGSTTTASFVVRVTLTDGSTAWLSGTAGVLAAGTGMTHVRGVVQQSNIASVTAPGFVMWHPAVNDKILVGPLYVGFHQPGSTLGATVGPGGNVLGTEQSPILSPETPPLWSATPTTGNLLRGNDLTMPGSAQWDVMAAAGGLIQVFLVPSSGATGVNGYQFRFDTRTGLTGAPASMWRMDNGAQTQIGTTALPTPATTLSGRHHLGIYIDASGNMSLYYDHQLAASATDTTYPLSGAVPTYVGGQIVAGAILPPQLVQATVDQLSDGSTYGRTVQTALTSGQVDVSKSGVINRTADNVAETTGRKWAAQTGADVTSTKTSADTTAVAGTASATVRDNAAAGNALTVAGSGKTVGDGRNSGGNIVGGLASAYWDSYTITSAYDSTTATSSLTFQGTTLHVQGVAISYGSSTVSGLTPGANYWMYIDDASVSGAGVLAVTGSKPAVTQGNGRIYIAGPNANGSVTTATSGGGGGGSPPPTSCVTAEMYVWSKRGFILAGDVIVGDELMAFSGGRRLGWARVTGTPREVIAPCVRVSAGGFTLDCSASTPFDLSDGQSLIAEAMDGQEVMTPRGWRTAEILPLGDRRVMYISLGGLSFAAGTRPEAWIVSHNIVKN